MTHKHEYFTQDDAGNEVAVWNFDDFNKLDSAGKGSFVRNMEDQLKMIDHLNTNDIEHIVNKFKQVADNVDGALGPGGATTMDISGLKIVLISPETSSLEEYTQFSTDNTNQVIDFTPEQEKIFDRYVREHEFAHKVSDLEEPGSDFISAVRLLKGAPDAREVLEHLADMRLIYPMMNDNVRIDKIHEYGFECYDAIQAALSLTDEELANLTHEELVETAKSFDNVVKKQIEDDPYMDNALVEEKVYAALRGTTIEGGVLVEPVNQEMVDIMDSGDFDEIAAHADSLIEKGVFPERSKEARVLREFSDSAERMAVRNEEKSLSARHDAGGWLDESADVVALEDLEAANFGVVMLSTNSNIPSQQAPAESQLTCSVQKQNIFKGLDV